MNYSALFWQALPEVVLVVTALVVLALGLGGARKRMLCAGVGAAGLLFAMAAVLTLPAHADLLHGMLVVSPLNSLFKLICLVLVFLTLAVPGSRSSGAQGEDLALLLFAAVGMLLLIGSEELLMVFIGLELTGLSLYLLTGFAKSRQSAAEAGLKYFLFGSVASAFTLFGISLVYGMTGVTALAEIAQKIGAGPLPPLFVAGVVLTLIGFAFKIAVAPFHFWVGDTYEAAPVRSAALIASASKVASFVVLGKIVLLGFGPQAGSAGWHTFVAGWKPVLALLAALSILVGNLLALAQKNVRRLLGYSAVAHGGYTLLGIVAGPAGFAATLFYTTIYAFTLIGAFAAVGLVRQISGGDDLSDFAGMRARSPLVAACLAVLLLSLAGLPPLAGFFGKFYLFAAAMDALPPAGLAWLVAIALFGSLISLYYYLTVIKLMFVDPPATVSQRSSDIVAEASSFSLTKVTLVGLALLILLAGIYPTPLVNSIVGALR